MSCVIGTYIMHRSQGFLWLTSMKQVLWIGGLTNVRTSLGTESSCPLEGLRLLAVQGQ